MMTKFKVGDKVRIVDVRKIVGGLRYFKNGDTTHILEVDSDDYPYLYCNDGDYKDGLILAEGELEGIEVIIAEQPSDSERITALETQVVELQAELQTLKKRKKPKHLLTHYPTPNEQRKAVIERAKAFVGESKRKVSGIVASGLPAEGTRLEISDVYSPRHNGRRTACNAEFIVNVDKRTVAVLLKGIVTGKLYAKGIAKCAPDDVFNADIGKAIALGRALGLDVSEFDNAPKPTAVVVGMRVGNMYDEITYKVTSIADGKLYVDGSEQYWRVDTLSQSVTFITEDTEAKY